MNARAAGPPAATNSTATTADSTARSAIPRGSGAMIRGRVRFVAAARDRATLRSVLAEEKTMEFIWTLIVGLIAGALAKLVMPGKDAGGIIATMLLGIAGSFVAAFLGRALGWYSQVNEGPGIIASIIGALVLLGIYRLAVGRSMRS
jgi:uncharacterized membrane protein YeaQ/YmgE (transglycosylase-associated protein family)